MDIGCRLTIICPLNFLVCTLAHFQRKIRGAGRLKLSPCHMSIFVCGSLIWDGKQCPKQQLASELFCERMAGLACSAQMTLGLTYDGSLTSVSSAMALRDAQGNPHPSRPPGQPIRSAQQ